MADAVIPDRRFILNIVEVDPIDGVTPLFRVDAQTMKPTVRAAYVMGSVPAAAGRLDDPEVFKRYVWPSVAAVLNALQSGIDREAVDEHPADGEAIDLSMPADAAGAAGAAGGLDGTKAPS